jgi:hypothetical protein
VNVAAPKPLALRTTPVEVYGSPTVSDCPLMRRMLADAPVTNDRPTLPVALGSSVKVPIVLSATSATSVSWLPLPALRTTGPDRSRLHETSEFRATLKVSVFVIAVVSSNVT